MARIHTRVKQLCPVLKIWKTGARHMPLKLISTIQIPVARWDRMLPWCHLIDIHTIQYISLHKKYTISIRIRVDNIIPQYYFLKIKTESRKTKGKHDLSCISCPVMHDIFVVLWGWVIGGLEHVNFKCVNFPFSCFSTRRSISKKI